MNVTQVTSWLEEDDFVEGEETLDPAELDAALHANREELREWREGKTRARFTFADGTVAMMTRAEYGAYLRRRLGAGAKDLAA